MRVFAIAEWFGFGPQTAEDGVIFNVVDAEPGDFWPMNDDDDEMSIATDAEILAGRRGVRVRVVPYADPSTSPNKYWHSVSGGLDDESARA